MTRFKICGLRDLPHALIAAESGADLVGFVFVEGVRRQLRPEMAVEIITALRDGASGETPGIVGLFANQSPRFINEVTELCGLDFLQLCGDEPPEMWDQLDARVIRQVKVREDLPRDQSLALACRQVEEALDAGQRVLLDKHQAGHLGGTGIVFDWRLAREIARDYRVTLAGGLTPENVSEAIDTVKPWAVDVSTGVETDGVKDPEKIRAFAAAVRAAG